VFEFLPPAEPIELGEPPLVQVIAQVKFEHHSELSTPEGVGRLHDRLAHRYPRLLSEPQQTITAAPSGVTSAVTQHWRMTNLGGELSCIVGPEQIAIETKTYSRWEMLRGHIQEALEALSDVTTVRVCERAGLRYVNHIPSGDGGTFTGRIKAPLLGLAGSPEWSSAITASLSQTIVKDGDVSLALRFGTGINVVGAENAFILDIDCFSDNPAKYDEHHVLAAFDQYNDAVYRCFLSCIEEEFHSALATANQGGDNE
jgi:uncharacterized protein (TIGR04255 family)